MFKLSNLTQSAIFIIPVTTALLLTSELSNAQIYKWRDEMGRMQYSDTPPPATSATKATPSEVVNFLQQKDLCTIPQKQNIKQAALSEDFVTSPFAFFSSDSVNEELTSRIDRLAERIEKTEKRMKAAKESDNKWRYQRLKRKLKRQEAILNRLNRKLVAEESAPAPAPAPAPAANIVQKGLMPAVDLSLEPTPAVGHSTVRIRQTNGTTGDGGGNGNAGQFRTVCGFSHMANDDPLVYPNQQGASHHHTFFGNTTTNYKSDVRNMRNIGNSTCAGGIANRSAYWVPSLIDTQTNAPLQPTKAMFYYKTWDAKNVTTPPQSLRMIAGIASATKINPQDPNPHGQETIRWSCKGQPFARSTSIPACNGTLALLINFPMCWDGKNQDSPDHKSHMSYRVKGSCPSSHPVTIPDITFNIFWDVGSTGTSNLRLSSDNYTGGSGGESAHGDWINGWDPKVINTFVTHCLKAKRDCHGYLLGDGTGVY